MKKNVLLLFLLNASFVFGLMPNTAHAQVTFSGSHENVNPGNEVCLDVSATGFESIIAAQFSMHYDNNLLEFTGFSNLAVLPIPVNSFAVFQEDGLINFSWFHLPLTGRTLADDEIIFSVCFNATGSGNAISPFSFDDTPVIIEVLDADENMLNTNFNSGSVTISDMNTMLEVIGSTVNHEWCNDGEGSISLHVTGGTLPYSYQWMGPDGFSSTGENISNLTSGSYTVTIEDAEGTSIEASFSVENNEIDINSEITPTYCNEDNGTISLATNTLSPTFEWSNGETTAYIQGLAVGDYSVTVTEGTCITSQSFSIEDNGGFASYSYICEDIDPENTNLEITAAVWCGGQSPFTFEWSTGETTSASDDNGLTVSSINIPNSAQTDYAVTITNNSGFEYIIDDIQVDCGANTEDLHLAISPVQTQIQTGESTCLDLVVTNFTDIISLQFTVEWNDALLHFDEVNNLNLANLSNSNFGDIGNGQLTFSWTDLNLDGETLADNSSLFSICFTGATEGNASVQITNTPTLIEAYNIDNQEENVIATGGLVTIGNGGNGDTPTLYASTEIGIEGEIVCVDINATNIYNMLGMQFSVNWDTDMLNFIGVENFVFENIMPISTVFSSFDEAVENGNIGMAYIHNDLLNGYSFPSDTRLFQLCFEITGTSGNTPISISNTPVAIEFVDQNESLISITPVAGEVIIEDALWPGDTDNNGIVNQYDLLNIGLAYGASGTPRTLFGTDWTAYYTPNWGQSTPNSAIDYKHIDTNGNGQINGEDQLALELNWGESNDFWDGDTPSYLSPIPEDNTVLLAPFYMESDTLVLGQSAVLDIILGELDQPADHIYGLAFTISYDADMVEPSSVHAIFDNSWLGTIDENIISIYREDAENGKLHVAVTKTDGIEMSGHGAIGQMEITIKDVIFRDELVPLALSIEDLRLITYAEEEVPVESMSSTTYVDATTGTINPALNAKISLYPIPTDDKISIVARDINIQKMELLQIDGKRLLDFEDKKVISLKKFNSGNYLLKIITTEGVIVKHIIKN